MSGEASEFGITAVDVTKSFARGPETVVALDGASLSVAPGEIVALSGPSGSGKSTLFDILLGWQTRGSGVVDIRAEDRAGSVGVVTQDLALFEELTAAENLAIAARLADNANPDGLITLLELDELQDRAASELSLGQQQRVAVARALVSKPSVVIADEPTSHQDAERAMLVMNALRQTADNGAAVLVTSHDPLLIERCDREIQIVGGRVADAGVRTAAPLSSEIARRAPGATIRFLVALLLAIVGVVALIALM